MIDSDDTHHDILAPSRQHDHEIGAPITDLTDRPRDRHAD